MEISNIIPVITFVLPSQYKVFNLYSNSRVSSCPKKYISYSYSSSTKLDNFPKPIYIILPEGQNTLKANRINFFVSHSLL